MSAFGSAATVMTDLAEAQAALEKSTEVRIFHFLFFLKLLLNLLLGVEHGSDV
jgi:hypothetical protein